MKTLELRKSDYLSEMPGAKITFHLITWDNGVKPFSIKAGGNINYTTLASESTSSHTHEFCEILLIVSGKIKHLVNGEEQELEEGSLVFIRPSDAHSFNQVGNEQCELVSFAFQLELLMDFSIYMENDLFLWQFTAPVLPPTFKLSKTETENYAFQLLHINSLGVQEIQMARLKIKSILAEMLTKFFLREQELAPDSGQPPWFDNLCADMRSEENLKKGLKAMQSMAGCTPEHLCKVFKKYLNKSPTEFINELRVNHGARLLADTDDKIYSIATDLGFKSLSRFYHIFKKYYSVSPARYRAIARKNDIPI
jgi:AraC family cel operon transcriptional repressor